MNGEEYRPKEPGESFTYHFDREEYHRTKHTRIVVPKKSRPFRDNRTLLIIMLDIAIIVIFALIIVPLIRKPYSISNFEGYSMNLSAFRSKGKTFVSLKIENSGKENIAEEGAGFGKIRFYTDDGVSSDTFSVLLPVRGKSAEYGKFVESGSAKKAYADVSIGTKEMTLRVKILE